MKRKKVLFSIFLTLIIGIIAVICVYPLVMLLCNSFLPTDHVLHYYYSENVEIQMIPRMFSIEQYINIFTKNAFYLRSLLNSLLYATVITVFQLVIAIPAAFAFEKYEFKGKNLLFALYLFFMLIPTQVMQLPHYILMNRWTLLNTEFSIFFPNIFSTFGVCIIRQGIKYTESAVIDAGRLDGCGELRLIYSIVIPSICPYVIAATMLIFIDAWNMVEYPLIFLSDASKMPLTVFFSTNTERTNLFAMGTVALAFPIMLCIWMFDLFKDQIAFGELK